MSPAVEEGAKAALFYVSLPDVVTWPEVLDSAAPQGPCQSCTWYWSA